MAQPAEDPPETAEDTQENVQLTLRLDPVHYAALRRISGASNLKGQQAIRHLIRIADRFIQGDDSPFVDRLEGIFPKRKAV